MAISILRLRAELQNAIQSEKYDLAADLRDKISKLKAESLAASVKARGYENAQHAFRLGKKAKHTLFGYRALICGMDPVCCESKSWMEGAKIDKLTRGLGQTFYQSPKRIYLPLKSKTRMHLIILTPLFGFTAWMVLEISSQ
ncbi:clp protease adapter protein ClpF, chloroplastic-like isoform X4 [Primulina huaijiensis]|uniref:clp protease adapter protein ClpF, chloroplastic-like isoform X4 n=1 Tax=Primulina huaijiensis TaxID=1492673 RepID=UPI003CC77357